MAITEEELNASFERVLAKVQELTQQIASTQAELNAYRRVLDEIQQLREYGEARYAEGKAQGLAESRALRKAKEILMVLGAHGIVVEETARARILACDNMGTLDQWLVRAVVISSVEDLFGDSFPAS